VLFSSSINAFGTVAPASEPYRHSWRKSKCVAFPAWAAGRLGRDNGTVPTPGYPIGYWSIGWYRGPWTGPFLSPAHPLLCVPARVYFSRAHLGLRSWVLLATCTYPSSWLRLDGWPRSPSSSVSHLPSMRTQPSSLVPLLPSDLPHYWNQLVFLGFFFLSLGKLEKP
jgi:hypothetical protein